MAALDFSEEKEKGEGEKIEKRESILELPTMRSTRGRECGAVGWASTR